MNKRDLIDALSGRLGDKKSATEALNAVLETIQSAVASGRFRRLREERAPGSDGA